LSSLRKPALSADSLVHDIANNLVFDYILVKLAARCNIACKYCYWFRDESVYDKPRVLDIKAENAFLEKLEKHIVKYKMDSFFILFHGGEPLLLGKERFQALCQKLRNLEKELNFKLKLAITTNGILIDDDWAKMFKDYHVSVTVSIDGPKSIHDKNRIDFQYRGTFDKVLLSFNILRSNGIEPGVISVCNPDIDPKEIYDFFLNILDVKAFDILVPDANHEDHPKSIAHFYKRLFDLWYDDYSHEDVEIRYLHSIVRGLLGFESHSESIGYGPISTMTMLTDGSLEPLDVLRTAGNGITKTNLNIFEHEFQDIKRDPTWIEVLNASLNLPIVCQECPYKQACGGGHIASRWSKKNRWNNPSVYCDDIKNIMGHIWNRISRDTYIETDQRSMPLVEALKECSYEKIKDVIQ
jgi:uncharacterized protein